MNQLFGIRLQQLAYLDAVARLGHHRNAADALLVSQPALSQGLARLERSLGVTLFERVGRTSRLTPNGKAAASFARLVLAEADKMADLMEARAHGRLGRLRVGLVDAAALYLLDDEVRAFRDQYRQVDLDLSVDASGQLLASLDRFELDLAVVIGPAPNPTAVQVTSEPLYIYGPPLEAPARAKSWVLYPSQSRTRRYIDSALAQAGYEPTQITESTNPSVIAQLVRLGDAWTVLPEGIAESIADPLTRRSNAIAHRPLFVVRRVTAESDKLVESLTEVLLGQTKVGLTEPGTGQ